MTHDRRGEEGVLYSSFQKKKRLKTLKAFYFTSCPLLPPRKNTMPAYFSLACQTLREFSRSDQRFTDAPGTPLDGPSVEWRALNDINLTWLAKVLQNALQRPAEDEEWLGRAVVFSEFLRDTLDGLPGDEFDTFGFTEFPEPF